MKRNYIKMLGGPYKCLRCGKIVKEYEWGTHKAMHRKKAILDTKIVQKHIDTY